PAFPLIHYHEQKVSIYYRQNLKLLSSFKLLSIRIKTVYTFILAEKIRKNTTIVCYRKQLSFR
ncbi:MAG: hypothetical protein N4R10_03470, partial [Lactobacillus iners]|nr:hypothetical protein [Lactobacillus iners]